MINSFKEGDFIVKISINKKIIIPKNKYLLNEF